MRYLMVYIWTVTTVINTAPGARPTTQRNGGCTGTCHADTMTGSHSTSSFLPPLDTCSSPYSPLPAIHAPLPVALKGWRISRPLLTCTAGTPPACPPAPDTAMLHKRRGSLYAGTRPPSTSCLIKVCACAVHLLANTCIMPVRVFANHAIRYYIKHDHTIIND